MAIFGDFFASCISASRVQHISDLLSKFDVYIFIMAALWYKAGHYILPCGFFLSVFLLSSPNLSSRRLNVYNTSTHGVALLRI